MTRLQVYSRQMAESAPVSEPHIWISITDPSDELAAVPHDHDGDHCRGILRMQFHDFEKSSVYKERDNLDDSKAKEIDEFLSKYIIFNRDDAERIVDFVELHEGIPLICIHCEAGISRSAGCACALGLWINESDRFENHGQPKIPNTTVKATILRYLRERR